MADQQEQKQPPQHQPKQPGEMDLMTPEPDYEMKNYRAAGKLEGKAALVTGGDSGIGAAVAVAFAKEGADVCIVYLEEHGDAAKVKQAVEGAGRRCLALAGDVGQENFCREVVERSVGKALGTGNKEEDEKGAPDRKPQPREVEVFCPVASI